MEDKYDVDIKLNSTIERPDMPREATVSHTQGQLFIKDKTYYLRYTENMEGIGDVSNTIKMDDTEAVVIRKGPVSMRQHLVPGEETQGVYHNPFGQMTMVTNTKQCAILWDSGKAKGHIDLRYHLKIQGEPVGAFKLIFEIQEVHT
ncbi:DUF1934 domain-containing protein [Tuberibacillus sp. Marseille-P3662]|uniref:DUF1934 domain-containing protein n=1 Tax=Tuberibacillus sp. Marseille-P3662 TaxID=1965358 RepID=UPI001592ED76|nr:DUF1934 domain-containing protein [Tuberibacillus sp. Marseille-P3662]